MNKNPPSRKNVTLFIVLLTVLICFVLPVAGGEKDAGPLETRAPPELPANITNTSAPAFTLALAAEPPAGPVPLTVRFTGAAAGLAVDLWEWTVDGVVAADENESIFTHTFHTPGTHVVGLTAVNESASVTNASSVEIVAEEHVTAPPPVVMADPPDPPAGTHPRDWYVSPVPGTGNPQGYTNVTRLLDIPDLGAGDTVHVWGAAGHTYEGGTVINAPDVTVKRWEGSPVQPLITSARTTAPAFTVKADNATFFDLNISDNQFNGNGAAINAVGENDNNHLKRLTITNCTFVGNKVSGAGENAGGALRGQYIDDLLIEGTTFTNNTAWPYNGGASFGYCRNITLANTTFTRNHATNGGGVGFYECDNTTLTGVTFTENDADYGGGAYLVNCEAATLADTTFTRNDADYGGGVGFSGSHDAVLTNATFTDNTAHNGGGAYFMSSNNPSLTGTTFTDNNATEFGGGAYFDKCQNPTLPGTTFTGNNADRYGGGAYFGRCDAATLPGTTFTGNNADRYGGAYFENCNAATLADTTFTRNHASNGGGVGFSGSRDAVLTNATFTDNTAANGGGAYFMSSPNAALTGTTFTDNNATEYGGGAYFYGCDAATLTGTIFTDNTANKNGGGVLFNSCNAATVTNCRFDNPINLYMYNSDAVFNTTRTPGTNIAGGPYLGGNLWLQDPAHNISEWGADADFDGICDENLTITGFTTYFGTDHLPLKCGGGTVQINATPSADGAFVFVDDTNTTRTANRTFYLPVGNHTVSVQKEGFFTGEQDVNVTAGENDPLTFDLREINHPMDWYVSTIRGDENLTSLLEITDLGAGDTVHVWGVAGHTYEGGVVINASDVTVTRWEGSPVQPLITSASNTTSAFTLTVKADNATFRDLNISRNQLNGNGAGINVVGNPGNHLKRLTITDCTFAGNEVNGQFTCGGALHARYVDDLLVEGTTFTGNRADEDGGGACILYCTAATITNVTFTGNTADNDGGGAYFYDCYPATLPGTKFTSNTATRGGGAYVSGCMNATLPGTTFTDNGANYGGGAFFDTCDVAMLTGTPFTDNNATVYGGGVLFFDSDFVTLTNATFTGNTATDGGGAYFEEFYNATITNCRFDNPTNIYAKSSTAAALNGTYAPGTNIAGGPNLGGNLWLQDPAQNISEWGADADFDGICDETLTITGFGTDALPLKCGGGTVQINATPADVFVFVDDTNTTRTANRTFYLRVGNRTVFVQKDGVSSEVKEVDIVPGENDPLSFDLNQSVEHPTDWYVSKVGGGENLTSLLDIPDLGAGDTVHVWGVAGHTYEGGVVINASDVTVTRWEGSPVQPLITSTSGVSAFSVTADNATFRDLNISRNRLNNKYGAGINAAGKNENTPLKRLTVTDCTFTGNEVKGTSISGGALSARYVNDFLVAGTKFTGNTADRGGGVFFWDSHNATLTNATFTGNTADHWGGGAYIYNCDAATLTATTFTGNTADDGGGGALFYDCDATTITNCRFDNPTNIYARGSTAVLNGTYAPGTTIAGGPYLGGNLWLNDTAQNISEWGADADFDGICDQALTITGFGTDALPLVYGGTVQINATPADAFVFVDDTNTTRTANRTFYLKVGGHTVSVQKDGVSSEVKEVAIVPGENDPLTFALREPVEHPTDWYVSKVGGDENLTSLLEIPDLGAGDTVHVWGVAGHTYEGGVVINASNVTVKRWEGSPVQPLITSASTTAPAFSVNADNTTFLDLNISRNRLDFDRSSGAGINAVGTYDDPLQRLTITNCTFTGNAVNGTGTEGGALYARFVADLLVEGTTFADNTADYGGGACIRYCTAATLPGTTLADNTAQFGGGLFVQATDNLLVEGTGFTGNTAEFGGGASIENCNAATFTDITLADNSATYNGGGADFMGSDGVTLTNATVTGNTAESGCGGGACFDNCQNPTFTGTTLAGNTARYGGGAYFGMCTNALLTGTALTGNTATDGGGGAYFYDSTNATLTNCRFDNPTNIYAYDSTAAALNGTYAPGTTIAGGPFLGGNLWLNDTAQNISEWGTDADFDGICDENLTINNSDNSLFGTDHLPLIYGGTVQINATPSADGAFVFVDDTNTTRTANRTFYLRVGNHTVSVQKDGVSSATKRVTIAPGENDPLSFDLNQSVEHPTDWYVSKVGGDENLTSLLDIPDLGEGDTVHVWGVAGHTYEGGVVINASNVTVTRWEGSPVQPLITSAPYTAPAFTVNADNTTFLDLNISRNRLRSNYDDGAGINARGAYESHLKRLAITNCTFTGNAVEGKNAHGGALYAEFVDDILVEGATFTGNTAKDGCGGGAYFVSCTAPTLASTSFNNNAADRFGGGAHFFWCTNALLTTTTFTDNTATDGGGGAYFYDSTNATLTTTTLTGNTATNGGGASFRDSKNATVTNCRFDNPTNIYAKSSTAAALNGTYAPGTNIAGGPNLGGNLWLNDTAQNISEWGADADFDGICDETLTITGFGTDALPLIYGGTVQINATPSDAFVFVDDTNTTRTANRTFYLPVGNRTVFVQKDGVSSEVKEVAIVPGENDPLSFTLTEPVEHPTDWYISKVVGGENLTSLLDIPDLGAGDTVHIWGVAGHAYDSGTVIDAPNVTVKRWEGSPVQPLITNISGTTPAFSVTADNATFRDLNISRNQLNGKGAAINASGAYESHLQHLTIADCTFDGNMADQAGGALSAWYVDDLLVEGAVFTDNTASNHGGGAYFNNCQNPTLTTTAFANNSATYNGGGAEFYSCEDAALTAITFINNTAPYGGGACFWYSEDATLTNTTFTDNKASQYGGGAFFIFSINAVYTNTTFADNKAGQYGGGAFIYICDAATLTGTALTGNNATEFGGGAFIYKSRNATLTGTALTGNTADEGGGAYFMSSPNATLTNATFTGNTADEGGGAYFMSSPNATLTTTALTGNTADEGGGGAYFNESHNATIVNCRLDNPTNIYAYESTAAALNGTYAPGTTIAGGPYLGGNLWLNGTDQNLSEWGADVDCDGICDETLTITGFGTDELPLVDGGNRGTALIRASAYGGFVYVDGVNTTRTADSFAPVPRAVVRADDPTPPSDAFFIPAGTHTIEIVGPMTYGRASVDLLAGTTERVTVEVNEVDIEGYAAPRQGPAPLNVSFDTECTDPWPDRLVWTFGDGDESNPCPGPSHVYEKAGTYTATLTAAWGETSDLVTLVRTVEIVVGMSEPLLILSATEGNAPFTLDVNVSSGGTPERWDLDLGDGRQVNGTSPAEINRSVTYDTPGTYPITLTVSTGEVTNATTRTVTVLAPPVAAFDLSPREGNAPLDVGFTDTSTGDITAWSWDFGDGATSTDPSPTHRYERGGTYTVQLTVSNAYGSSTAEQSVVVSTPGPGGRSSPSSGGGSTTSAGSAGTILAGDTASLVLHDSAIYEVRVTAAETIPKVMVTIGKTARPSGVEAPAGTVYEYDEVTLYHTTEDAIEGALLLFKVPKTWLEEHGLTPADVVLYRYHDDEWQALPNEVVREDETFWHFSAKSAGFSLFAIGGDPSPVETPVMTPGAPVETPAPITPSPPAAGPTPAGTEPPFLMMVLVVAAAVALFVVGMVVWRRR